MGVFLYLAKGGWVRTPVIIADIIVIIAIIGIIWIIIIINIMHFSSLLSFSSSSTWSWLSSSWYLFWRGCHSIFGQGWVAPPVIVGFYCLTLIIILISFFSQWWADSCHHRHHCQVIIMIIAVMITGISVIILTILSLRILFITIIVIFLAENVILYLALGGWALNSVPVLISDDLWSWSYLWWSLRSRRATWRSCCLQSSSCFICWGLLGTDKPMFVSSKTTANSWPAINKTSNQVLIDFWLACGENLNQKWFLSSWEMVGRWRSCKASPTPVWRA